MHFRPVFNDIAIIYLYFGYAVKSMFDIFLPKFEMLPKGVTHTILTQIFLTHIDNTVS